MTSNRIGGPTSPEPGGKGQEKIQPQQHRRVEKVEKVSEVDPDEPTRKKFRHFMDDEEEGPPQTRAPSPFETEFYFEPKKEGAVPSAPYAPAPDVNAAPSHSHDVDEATGLPRSDEFWKGVDAPPDHPPQKSQMKEAEHKKKGSQIPIPTHAESPFGPPGKAKKKETLSPFEVPKEKVEKAPGKGKPTKRGREESMLGQEKVPASPFAAPPGKSKEEHEKEEEAISRDKEAMAAPLQPVEREGGRGRERGKRFVEVEAPTATPLPANIAPVAQAAASAAAPYLSEQVLPLFYQMVGTITLMAAKEVSTTEITLNSPSFANSKFFGATIRIEKYATAPDALNIRLTGSDAAVRAFNQAVPSLYMAFKNGNFKYRIGLIEASYTLERPVFRRKEPGRDKGDFGGDFEDRSR